VSLNSIILETAVKNFIPQIKVEVKKELSWHDLSEPELLKELTICLLSSSVKYEVACGYVESISRKNLFDSWTKKSPDLSQIINILSTPIISNGGYVRYRFPMVRSQQLFNLVVNVYGKNLSIKSILKNYKNPNKVREVIIKNCPGIGNKQSSMFLRNIGFSNRLAILDTHLIDYLKSIHVIPEDYMLNTQKKYFQVEEKYLEYANSKGLDISCLDSAIWLIMKVYKKEFV
jgi:N-glycosylase/DNA lyase